MTRPSLLIAASVALAATGSGQLALGLDAAVVADAVALGQHSRPLKTLPEGDHTH